MGERSYCLPRSSCAAFLFVVGATPAWPIEYVYAPDNMPIVQVRLAPPTNPLPEVAAVVGFLEKDREQFEAAKLAEVEAAFNASLKEAAIVIPDTIDRLMRKLDSYPVVGTLRQKKVRHHAEAISFHEARSGDGTRKLSGAVISVSPVASPSDTLRANIEAVETKRSQEEGAIFDQAESEMKGLTQIVAREIEVHVTRYVNAIAHAIQFGSNPHPISDAKMNATSLRFLTEAQPVFERGSQLMTNVKVMASEKSFPTVGSMVEDMERRRDAVEDSMKSQILDLELELLQTLNESLRCRLGSWVEHLLRAVM